ncbi:hypothetical protein R5R35_014097 [Gryllus longicercus]|uniref:Uncharacterized protein n=1 Tax=Gryllus longicercus TaxID=2509291 RepID=A0AAN9ZE95_9ORTH
MSAWASVLAAACAAALCTAAAADGVNSHKPQRVQLPAPFLPLAMTPEHLQVTSTPQTPTPPGSNIQPQSDLSSDLPHRPPSQPPSKLPAQPPQELPKQPECELPTLLRKEPPTRPAQKLVVQPSSGFPTQPLQASPTTTLPDRPPQPTMHLQTPPEINTQLLRQSSTQTALELPEKQLQESTQQFLELPRDLSTELPIQSPLELSTMQPPDLPNSPSLSPSQHPGRTFRPYMPSLPQPTIQEASEKPLQSSHSPPELSTQSPSTSSTQRSPHSSQRPPKSSTQQAPKSLPQPTWQSSKRTPSLQFTPLSSPQPLPQTLDSGKKCNCFHELPEWRWLDCSSRNRSIIQADDLCDEFATHVNLSHNRFLSLPENLGENVRSVNLSHNLLTTIPRSPPLHPKTRTLDLSFNRITNSSDELRDMLYMSSLYVQGNRLQSLDFLPSPCALNVLLASHNQLRSLEGPLFFCVLAVEIDLSWNQLNELSKNVIRNLYYLRTLHLVHSGLTNIPPGVFGVSLYLRYVDLSQNKLTTLPSRAFDGGFIETILLDKNKISSLPNDTFSKRYSYSIKKISLAQNKLKTIPEGLFSELDSLEHLNVNQNYFRYLPNGIFDGLNLTEIGLRLNLLDNLPPRLFSGLKNLKRIDLGGNQLASVPDDLLSGLSDLKLLDVSDNLLTTVPSGLFNGVKSIEVLDLSFNQLSTFSGSQLEGLHHVEWLYLKGNQLKELPVFDAKWPQVVRFHVEKNHIEELSEAAVRSWLGDGSRARRVSLGGRQWLRSVASLRWVVGDPHATAIVNVADCRCGFVNRGRAHLFFCASVSCPADAANWVDAASRTATSTRRRRHTDS